jgi:PAS domain S-box-containing protein
MAESTVESVAEVSLELAEKRPMRVLHVDDEPNFLKSAKQCLEMQGNFHVETTSSVEEAMKKMKKKTFDVVVADYVMPGKDGLEFLKELRDSGNNIPFIIFTGKGREEVAIRALNLGADRYFNKIGRPEAVYGELAHGIRRAVGERRAQMEVWRRKERLRAILASSPDAIIIIDLKANVIDCNEATLKLVGASSKKEIIGKSSFEFIAEKDRERASKSLKRTFIQGTVKNREYTLMKTDGQEYQGELSASVLKDSSGNPIGFVGIVRDITERKKAEEALRKSEHYLCKAQQIAHFGSWVLDVKTNRVEFSDEMFNIFGITKEQFIGTPEYTNNLVQPEDRARVQECYEDLLIRHKPASMEYSIIRPDGSVRYLWGNGEVEFDEKGNLQHLVGTVLDITERKTMEKILRKSERQASAAIEVARALTFSYDIASGKINWGGAIEEITGYTREEFAKIDVDGWADRIHPDDRDRILAILQEAMGKDRATAEYRFKTKKGYVTLSSISLTEKQDGKAVRLVGILQDITERKRLEEHLKKSEKKYRQLVNSLYEGIWVIDKDAYTTFVNTRMAEILGYTPDEMLGKHLFEVMDKKGVEICKRNLERRKSGIEEEHDFEFLRKDGTQVYTRMATSPLTDDKGNYVGAIAGVMNITERKKLEEKLMESEEKYRTQFEEAMDAIFVADAETGIMLDCNNAALKLVGREKSDVVGKHQRILHPSKEIKGEFSRTYKQHLKEKEGQVLEAQVITKKGEIKDVAIKANIFELRGKKWFREYSETSQNVRKQRTDIKG